MATIAFVSLYDRNAYGQRLLSAQLKRAGHTCHMIFLKRYNTRRDYLGQVEVGEYPWIGVNDRGREFKYASNSPITVRELAYLREVLERIKPDLIGMTVNTPLRLQNSRVTKFIKQFSSAPIVWGGYDPTVNPAQCLDLCDYACIGEGDATILQLAECLNRGDPFDAVCNLVFRRDGRTVLNRKAPAVQDMDSLPWRDDAPENKYFIEDDRLIEHYTIVNDRAPGSYQTMTSRGCPYRCTYCCEASLKDLYAGEKFLRRRSPHDCVAELCHARDQFQLTEVVFEDEIFGMDIKWLLEFVPLYRERIGLPFTAYIYPTRNVDKLLPLLKEAGLSYCCLALESGSVRINKEIFDRVYNRELFLRTAELCRNLGIEFYTDVITYNPYEEESDLKETLDVLLEIGGDFDMCLNKLFVLPGTRLAERMERDGKEVGDHSRDGLFNYYARLFWIASFSPAAPSVVNLIERLRVFRRHPEWLKLGPIEWLLRGPIRNLFAPAAGSRLRDRNPSERPKPTAICT